MIPNVRDRAITSKGVEESGVFGISIKHSAHIMKILRDTMYSDKVLAVLREYSANAWDSHRMAGKPNLPIKIVLPTSEDPTLTIQDFGVGLSKTDVFQVFTQYGASTKRDTDAAVGMLGIGSKSGFAYSDSFTVISCHGGKKLTFVAALDKSEMGVIDLLNEEECELGITGVTIQLAVKPSDIHEFAEKAKKLFRYFKPLPDINVELPKLPPSQAELKSGVIFSSDRQGNYFHGNVSHDYDGDHSWKAVMGCVPYRINLSEIVDSKGVSTISNSVSNLRGALFFNIGDVEINASREDLKYSESTKEIIAKKFGELLEEYVRQTIDGIKNEKLGLWDQRLRLAILQTMGLPVPKEWKVMAEQLVDLKKNPPPKTVTICTKNKGSNYHSVSSIRVTDKARLILKTSNKAMDSYETEAGDYIVRKDDAEDEWDEVRKDLDEWCEKVKITGIPIVDISSISVDPNYTPAIPSEKLKGKRFIFKAEEDHGLYSPYSRFWHVTKKDPTPEDVYLIMHKYRPKGSCSDFYNRYTTDLQLAETFKFEMPTIIGYRTTVKYQISEKQVPGITYHEWSEKKRAEILASPGYLEYVTKAKEASRYGERHFYTNTPKARSLVTKLGEAHVISQMILKRLEMAEYFKTNEDVINMYERIGRVYQGANVSRPELKLIKETYKLLDNSDPVETILRSSLTGHWLKYIYAVDNNLPPKKAPTNGDGTEVHDDE